ncbi:hypothetical protein G7046_g692 [Stylonectria norvegica]|nr:hypothetical protein G7046_g692 [Stylonectria norvegica]
MKLFTTSALVALCLSFTSVTAATLQSVPIIEKIAPKSKTCDASLPDCRTATQAGPFIALGMWQYNIYSVRQMAAVISLMAYESSDFAYKHNSFPPPGRPGQGTANMQSPGFNLKYAQQIDALKDKVAPYKTVVGASNDTLDAILALVTPDEYNFASGPWFLTTQCEPSVRETLDKDPDAGFEAYMDCVGVNVDDGRLAYWKRAKEAFYIQ